jgi:hypothetical protein
MSGARVALGSVPAKGISVDGVVAVLPRDTMLLKHPVAATKTVLKGQAVVISAGTKADVEPSVNAESRVFAGVAESSGTQDLTTYTTAIPIVTVVRGPIARGVPGEDLAAAIYAKAGTDGKWYVAANFAASHARVRALVTAVQYNAADLTGVDLEFWTLGK